MFGFFGKDLLGLTGAPGFSNLAYTKKLLIKVQGAMAAWLITDIYMFP